MLFVKYLFTTVGFGLLLAAAGVLIYDLYLFLKPQPTPEIRILVLRWRMALRVAAAGSIPLLIGLGIQVVPSGRAGVRISQLGELCPARFIRACIGHFR